MDRKPPALAGQTEQLDVLGPMTERPLNPAWTTAVKAAQAKQAADIIGLDLRAMSSFTDCFIICSGSNQRQLQAICDKIEHRLKKEEGERPHSIEGANGAEWILMDYGDMVIHVFSKKARDYYDLERLYRGARRLDLPPEEPIPAPMRWDDGEEDEDEQDKENDEDNGAGE